jgi:molybdopterin/thiamine biosynthesis adenylyltransferase
MKQRYLKNFQTLSQTEQDLLLTKKISIVGCGGLGQYIAMLFCRVGIHSLSIIDHDVFDETNLNRQLFCNVKNIGKFKVLETKEQLHLVNPEVLISAYQERFSDDNATKFLNTADVVIDALDNIKDRLLLQKYCKELNLPLITAAIGGWYGHLAVIQPGDDTLSRIYPDPEKRGVETILGNPAFTPCVVASMQVCETIKLLLGKSNLDKGGVLYIDLLNNVFETYSLQN